MDTTRELREARSRDLWALSWAQSQAVFRYRSRFLRWLSVFYAIDVATQMADWIGRGEVSITGVGTNVVMTPAGRAKRIPANVFIIAVVIVALVDVLIYFERVTVGTWFVAVVFIAVALLLVVAAFVVFYKQRGHSDEKAAIRELSQFGPVIRLHNLARPDADPRDLGTALLASIINDPRYAGTVVVATAAVDTLADRYEEAGMTRFTPTSRTVSYRA
jgi:hypothetical protein